jgi:hypothetical protein
MGMFVRCPPSLSCRIYAHLDDYVTRGAGLVPVQDRNYAKEAAIQRVIQKPLRSSCATPQCVISLRLAARSRSSSELVQTVPHVIAAICELLHTPHPRSGRPFLLCITLRAEPPYGDLFICAKDLFVEAKHPATEVGQSNSATACTLPR